MQIRYDSNADVLYIKLQDIPVHDTVNVGKGIFFDYDRIKEPVGIKIHQASRFFDDKKELNIKLAIPDSKSPGEELINDKKRVMNIANMLSDDNISDQRDDYTFGVVFSHFNQNEGPFPIITIPSTLENHFQFLVNLSDRAFSTTGFVEETSNENIATFDFSFDKIDMKCIAFAFAITVPEARGQKEDMTLTILLNQEYGEIINNFASEILPSVRWIREIAENKSPRENVVSQMEGLRNLVTRIIIAYKEVHNLE